MNPVSRGSDWDDDPDDSGSWDDDDEYEGDDEYERERELLHDDLASDSEDFSRSSDEGWFYSDDD